MTLARDELGLTVLERRIDRSEIYVCDEFFMTGTAAAVSAVTRVDHQDIGTGNMGPITKQLRELYDDLVRGKLGTYIDWNEPVYASEKMATE
jgi:branched-chain amino acid aminotransferase